MESTPPRRYAFITCPRTASNLAIKILNLEQQPEVALPAFHGGYYFLPAVLKCGELGTRDKPITEWTEEQRSEMLKAYQAGLDNFVTYTTSAQAAGKIAFLKEHANMFFGPTSVTKAIHPSQDCNEIPWLLQLPESYGTPSTRSALNETMVPDELLNTYYPVFLIRNPALMFPSFERNLAKIPGAVFDFKAAERFVAMTYKFTRSMYAYYADYFSSKPANNGVHWPLIIEADDIMNHPSLMNKIAGLMDMDATKTQFSWTKASEEHVKKMPIAMKSMMSTLLASDGIKKGLTSDGIDIDVEAKKWREEFGEETGTQIETMVRAAMPDYEFLKSKRMIPDSA